MLFHVDLFRLQIYADEKENFCIQRNEPLPFIFHTWYTSLTTKFLGDSGDAMFILLINALGRKSWRMPISYWPKSIPPPTISYSVRLL